MLRALVTAYLALSTMKRFTPVLCVKPNVYTHGRMSSFALNPMILPPESELRRAHIVPKKYRLEGYDDTYDFHTIAYDVVWMEQRKALLFVCPKLLNLETVFKASKIFADTSALPKPKIKRYRRHDEVWIKCPLKPSEVTLKFENLVLGVKPSSQNHEFDGKNVIMTKSKNNELVWISDWLSHHVHVQSATAALIFDNGSDTYSVTDLQRTMNATTGLDIAVAVASDFAFGSWKATKLLHRSMFYQAGMLSVTRHRFLHSARAVLPIDIDEMVCGANVFDAARFSRIGYVTIPCAWRYSKLDDARRPSHQDHIWRCEPDASCKEKYCLTPGRWFTDTVWDIHGLRRYAFNAISKLNDARIHHCEHISNGWKRKRDAQQGKYLIVDAQTQRDFEHLN